MRKKELRESLDFIDQNCHSEKSSASAAARAVLQKFRSVSKSSALFTAPSSFLLLLSEKAVPPKDQSLSKSFYYRAALCGGPPCTGTELLRRPTSRSERAARGDGVVALSRG